MPPFLYILRNYNQNMTMKYIEDEDFVAKQLYNSKSDNVNKLLKRYFKIKSSSK